MNVRFRTKGVPGQHPPGQFTGSSVRSALRNPFAAGLIARYPSKPLDMRDDPVHPERQLSAAIPTDNQRQAVQWVDGQHEAIIPAELWYANQLRRRTKGHTGTRASKPMRTTMYAGLAHCWECYAYDGKISNLRITTNSRGLDYGLCARLHDSRKKRRRPDPDTAAPALAASKLQAQPLPDDLAQRHQLIPRAKIEAAITALIDRLTIPTDWRDSIAAYYLTDAGLADFKRQGYVLQQQLQRVREMHTQQLLTAAQAQRQTLALQRELQRLQPASQPDAAGILPRLSDFPKLWTELEPMEQNGLLRAVFTDLFFDAHGQLRFIAANSPFNVMLGLPADGLLIE